MKDGARALAAEFKKFLSSREEDELIPAAGSAAAAPSIVKTLYQPPANFASADKKLAPDEKEQGHLTVVFARDKKKNSSTSPVTDTPQAAHSAQVDAQSPTQQEDTMTVQEKQTLLDQIAAEIKACHRCPLGDTRLNAVPGEGNPNAKLMFIGEGPGFDEDHKGRPFIGRAGQLLDKMIVAMGLKREEVFIGNIAKCHPMINPENPEAHGNDRAPNTEEIAVCRKYIERQIAAISPQYIIALGGVASKALISDTKSLGALRGKFHLLQLDSVELKKPIKIIATYHPAALLRNPNWKKDAWADLQMVMAEMGLKRPKA